MGGEERLSAATIQSQYLEPARVQLGPELGADFVQSTRHVASGI
jgi:hypothetical protein